MSKNMWWLHNLKGLGVQTLTLQTSKSPRQTICRWRWTRKKKKKIDHWKQSNLRAEDGLVLAIWEEEKEEECWSVRNSWHNRKTSSWIEKNKVCDCFTLQFLFIFLFVSRTEWLNQFVDWMITDYLWTQHSFIITSLWTKSSLLFIHW